MIQFQRLIQKQKEQFLLTWKKNEQEKQAEIAALEEALQDRRIRLSVAGSIAEAATDITRIFFTAQKTADLYLNEIASMKADAEKECAKMLEDARKQAETILAEAKNKRG